MQTGYRFRLYPTPAQAKTLLDWIGCQRFIYNAKVREDRYFRRFQKQALSLTGQFPPIDQQYTQFKDRELTPWLYGVPSQVLRNGAVRWKQAYSRFFQKLAGRPTLQRKHGAQSVWLTNELFRFEPEPDPVTGDVRYRLWIGTLKFPVGEIAYTAHRAHSVPNSLTLTVDSGQWFLSFSTDDGVPEVRPEELAAELALWPPDEFRAATVGVDRGIVIPACASTGEQFDFSPVQKARMAKKERARKRWQRRMARRTPGSGGWKKAQQRGARSQQYARNVRRDFAHQTSCRLVAPPAVRLIVFEDLRIRSMTKKPKARQDASGHWLRNQANAKAGLNAKILASAWGKTRDFARYKALRRHQLLVDGPPMGTSQACAACGYTHPDNRPQQAVFACQRCGNRAQADENASKVIAQRGVGLILSGLYAPKPTKRAMRLRNKVGVECSEPSPETAATPMEIPVRREEGHRTAHGSMKSETPATS